MIYITARATVNNIISALPAQHIFSQHDSRAVSAAQRTQVTKYAITIIRWYSTVVGTTDGGRYTRSKTFYDHCLPWFYRCVKSSYLPYNYYPVCGGAYILRERQTHSFNRKIVRKIAKLNRSSVYGLLSTLPRDVNANATRIIENVGINTIRKNKHDQRRNFK